ncbi:MAG: family 78 glycoside hydrolase catalytic domain [Ignavibacteria bacterium]|jgi:alpha-L-rhamnosidase
MKRYLPMALIIFFSIYLNAQNTNHKGSSLMSYDLRCEYLVNPVNIDINQPVLRWKLKAAKEGLRNLKQTSYRLLVASSVEKINNNLGDMWDSGKIKSENNAQIIYSGKKLSSRKRYYWKVCVWDKNNIQSEWSDIAFWQMSLLSKEDWRGAEWIGMENDDRTSEYVFRPFQTQDLEKPVMKKTHVSPLLRKEFIAKRKIKQAWGYISGLGYSELYINGEKIGENVLDPGQTNYDVFSLYVTYDITDKIDKGRNTFGIMLGNGFYGQNIGFVDWLEYDSPRVKAKIWIEYENGVIDSIVTSPDWKVSSGAIQYDNVYAGETYDARSEKDGWNENGYDDSLWLNASIVKSPNDSLRSQMLPPIKRRGVITPAKIIKGNDDKWIIDLGQNIAGWVKIRVKESPGKEIKMRFAENLNFEGNELDFTSTGHLATGVKQTNIYICKSNDWEEWEPRFTYAGFRFVEISGLTQKPDYETVVGIPVHTSFDVRGEFICSDSLLNKIQEISLWTILNNVHSVPEDCPHREKCGWLGDAHSTAETDLFNFDMFRFYVKYMRDIKSQLGRGGETYKGEKATPGIPANIAPGRRVCQEARVDWGAAIVLIPYYLYLYEGDISVFREFYPNMKDFIKYVERYESPEGIIMNGYGDWCPPGGRMECPPELSSTAFFYRTLNILNIMAKKFDDNQYAEWCEEKMMSVKENFNKAYLKRIEGTEHWHYGSQTADVLAYKFGLIPNDKLESLTNSLVYDVEEKHDEHISTGIHGQRYIYSSLCDLGYGDIAYKLLTTPSFPSLAYIISCDFTTWPETILRYKDTGPSSYESHNHPMQASFAAFFYETVAGIRPKIDAPGFKEFILKPNLLKKIEWQKTTYESTYGSIVSNWNCNENSFTWEIEIPCNTTAQIYLPASSLETIKESNRSIKDSNIKLVKYENGRAVINIGSGYYSFSSSIE